MKTCIPTTEIKQDIIDTQNEIDVYKTELKTLKKNPQENRLPVYFREGKILSRESFIKKLETILEFRNKEIN